MKTAVPVVRFALTAEPPIERSEKDLKSELVAVSSAKENLLGVERLSINVLEEREHRLRHDLKFAETGYKRLSLEPLTWTQGGWQRFPMFAMYSIHSPAMVIRSAEAVRNNGGDWLLEPRPFPEKLMQIYRRHQQGLSGGRITSFFDGVIPKNVREDIKKAEEVFTVKGDSYHPTHTDIFMVAEAKWVVGAEPKPPPLRHLDPLVVGWDGNDLWLISHFDLTSIERYMMDEFPALPAHTDLMVLPGKK